EVLERAFQPYHGVQIDIHELHGEAELVLARERFGGHRHPAFRRQVDLEREAHARRLLVHRGDEAAAAAEVVNANRRLERADAASVERAGKAPVHAAVGAGRGRRHQVEVGSTRGFHSRYHRLRTGRVGTTAAGAGVSTAGAASAAAAGASALTAASTG